jgi:hypothetical protein
MGEHRGGLKRLGGEEVVGDKSCVVHQMGPSAQDYIAVTEVPPYYLQPWEEAVGEIVSLFEQNRYYYIMLNDGKNDVFHFKLKEIPDIQIDDRVAVLKLDSGKELFRVIERDGGKKGASIPKDQHICHTAV